MSVFSEMSNKVAMGSHPTHVVESYVGPDRADDIDSEDAKEAAFRNIAGDISTHNGYIGPDWISRIGLQVRSADQQGMDELVKMSYENRGQYEGSARIDAQGSWDMWDNVLRGLLAVRTEQVPPRFV